MTNDLNLKKSPDSADRRHQHQPHRRRPSPSSSPANTCAVRVVKAGEASGQGVGYLEDGTMVVVEAPATGSASESTSSSPTPSKPPPAK